MPYKNKKVDAREKRARGKRLWAAMPKWKRVEYLVAYNLRRKGVKVRRVGRIRSPFDLLTKSGLRIEVKAAEYKPRRRVWTVSIQRYGKMAEQFVDYYVFMLSMSRVFGFRHKRLYVVVPSPVKQRQVVFTLSRLLTRWKDNVDSWSQIVEAEKGRRTK
jgi:hypothetical protein